MEKTRNKTSKISFLYRIQKYLIRNWQLWLMLLPAIVYIFIINYVPMYGIQLAFRKYNFSKGLTGGEWVGFKYFEQFFGSNMFWPVLRNTLRISLTSLIVGFPVPIILALIINQIKNQKWKRVFQTTIYIPYFIAVVVMVAMINVLFKNETGVLSNLFKALGIVGESTNILGSEKTFVWLYTLTSVWQGMGWNSIIYVAALSSVDGQLYDAAKIDGANRWRLVWHIDFPTILPTIMIMLIMNMGGILNVGFDKTFLMQNGLNIGVSQVISTYVYEVGIKSGQFSFGTAVGLFNNVFNFIFLMITNWVSKKTTGTGLM